MTKMITLMSWKIFPYLIIKNFKSMESPREKVEIEVLPMLEFLLLFGFAKVTKGKNNFSCNKEAKTLRIFQVGLVLVMHQ